MATQVSEQDRAIETTRDPINAVYVSQDVNNGNQGTSEVPNEGLTQAIPDRTESSSSSYGVTKVLVKFARRMAAAYDALVAPPATERGRIENAMVKAKHDRFISFLR